MTRRKLAQLILGLGMAAILPLATPAADSAPPPKPAVNLPRPKPSPANTRWVPMVDYDALDVKPQPIEQAPPLFPPGLKAMGVKAKVTVEFVIGKLGNVEAAQVLTSTDTRFNDACVAAALKWRFTVPKKRGEPVYCLVTQNLAFD